MNYFFHKTQRFMVEKTCSLHGRPKKRSGKIGGLH